MDCDFYTALSPIHGRGLFTNRYFPMGTMLFKISSLNGKVTDLGRWVNHSQNSNNIIVHKENDGYYAVSRIPIYPGREILGNYNFTPSCLEKPDSNWT